MDLFGLHDQSWKGLPGAIVLRMIIHRSMGAKAPLVTEYLSCHRITLIWYNYHGERGDGEVLWRVAASMLRMKLMPPRFEGADFA